jgi:hypothetical protein
MGRRDTGSKYTLQDVEGPNSFATVEFKRNKALFSSNCLGQRFLVKELWAQSIKEGVASTV